MNVVLRKSATKAYAVYNTDGKIIRVWTDESLAMIDARGMGLKKDGVGYHDILLVYLEGNWWPCLQDKPIDRANLSFEGCDPDQESLAQTLSKLDDNDLINLGIKHES